eukprot:3802437-Pyramimonas_sp.AAC.1
MPRLFERGWPSKAVEDGLKMTEEARMQGYPCQVCGFTASRSGPLSERPRCLEKVAAPDDPPESPDLRDPRFVL